MKKKDQTKKRLIYLRYLLPIVSMFATIAASFIPAYKYVIGGKLNEITSLWTLLGNSFSAARNVIFAATEQDAANLLFSKTVFWMLAVFVLLWAVAFAASLYSAIVAIKYFNSDDEVSAERSRTLFITFFPNRIVLSAVELLMLPLVLFPYILPLLYKNIWNYGVYVVLSAPDALIIGGAMLLAAFVLSVACAPWERRFGADLFRKRKSFEYAEEPTDTQADISNESNNSMYSKERAEQNERIRNLLRKKDNDEDKNNN